MTVTGATLGEWVAAARTRFAAAGLPDAAIEARLLLGGLLGLSNTEVFTGGDRVLDEAERRAIAAAIERRLKREPVHRILGHREFFGLDLRLSRDTLEPRPDTEILVEKMLFYLRRIVAEKGKARILDLGVGTGAIGLALLKECPQAECLGSDISEDALATAMANAHLNGVAERYGTVRSDWFAGIDEKFDVIVSNPPYIASNVIHELDPEVRDFDPLAALDGGEDGLDAYRAIAADAGSFLALHGVVGVEIGFDQKQSVTALFTQKGFLLAEAAQDYGHNDRVLVFACNNTK